MTRLPTSTTLLAAAGLVLANGVAACGGSGSGTPAPATAAASAPAAESQSASPAPGGEDSAVSIASFAYSPAELTVAAGTTVTWTNADALTVGFFGTGTLNVQNGGGVSSASGVIGRIAGSTGTVTVSGFSVPGSTWEMTGRLSVARLRQLECGRDLHPQEPQPRPALLRHQPVEGGLLRLHRRPGRHARRKHRPGEKSGGTRFPVVRRHVRREALVRIELTGSAAVPARLHGSIAISCIALLCLAASRAGYADPNEEQSGSNHAARSDRPIQP